MHQCEILYEGVDGIMPQNVVIWGHSFVRRFHEFLERNDIYNLGLNSDKFNIKCIGLGGLSLGQRRRLHSYDSQLSVDDLVVIDIGSNDLTSQLCCPEQFALDLMSYASYLIFGLDVKKVVILQILYRNHTPFVDYNSRVIFTNVALENLTKTAPGHVFFWKHRGMWNCQESIFSDDGIHLASSIGYPKYLTSIRDCIIRVNRWTQQ